jgi:signal transduction histidine kinase
MLFMIMIRILCLLTFFTLTLAAQAQTNIDSLVNALNTRTLTPAEQFKLYNRISFFYLDRNPAKALEYIEKGMALAQKEKNKHEISMFNNYLGTIYTKNTNYDTAFVYFEKALALAQEIEDKELEVIVCGNMGNAYNQQSKYIAALECYMKCLSFYETKEGNEANVILALCNIGGMHRVAGNEDQAIYYLEKAKKMSEKLNNTRGLIKTHFDLSTIYMDRGEADKALEYASKVIELSQATGETLFEIAGTQVLATIYYARSTPEVRDLDQAEKYALECLRLAEEYGNVYYVYSAWSSLSSIYREQKRYKESEEMALKAWMMDSTNLNESIALAATIVVANIALGNEEKAIYFFWKYNDLKNEYTNNSYHETINEMGVKYETEKKEMRIASLEKERKLSVILGIAILIIFLLAFGLSLFLHRLNIQKRRLIEQHVEQLEREKQLVAARAVLDGENAERSRLSRDLHDGLGGMLSLIKLNLKDMKSYSIMDAPDVKRFGKALDMLDESIGELRRVAHHIMPDSLVRNGLKSSLEDFCHAVPGACFQYIGSEERLDSSLEILLYRCTYELVTNALKHAQASHIDVQLMIDERFISLAVRDDGIGFDFDPQTVGAGLDNIRTRVTAAKGKLNIYSFRGNGTEINIEIERDPIT